MVILLGILGACGGKNYAPRPRGYFRIDFPEKTYKQYNGECPFKFEIPEYSFLIKEKEDNCWFDIYFPCYKATVYLTYRSVNNDIDTLLNDAHDFAYKHTIKADAIEENIKRHGGYMIDEWQYVDARQVPQDIRSRVRVN